MSTLSGHGEDKRPQPQRNRYSSEIVSPNHIKLTDNKHNKDFLSVE